MKPTDINIDTLVDYIDQYPWTMKIYLTATLLLPILALFLLAYIPHFLFLYGQKGCIK
jgi:hypothetical protein